MCKYCEGKAKPCYECSIAAGRPVENEDSMSSILGYD